MEYLIWKMRYYEKELLLLGGSSFEPNNVLSYIVFSPSKKNFAVTDKIFISIYYSNLGTCLW